MSSIRKLGTRAAPSAVALELWAAVAGVVLVLFVLAHLAGNFILFAGPEAYNAYSRQLHSLGVLLWGERLVLFAAFVAHASLTLWLFLENRVARGMAYAVPNSVGGTNFVKRTMAYTGMAIFVFVFLHLYDFTFRSKEGAVSVVPGLNSDQSLGLYGLVWNSFANPVHSALYVLAVWVVGLHLSNATSTIWVTLGVLTDSATAKANWFAVVLGVLVALGFSSVPLYILAVSYWTGV